jgi:altronate hydrolase
MEEDMDINCGLIMDGDANVDKMGEVIFKKILDIASGEKTKSELLGFGDNEFSPWQLGATL